ncbi:MAG: IS1634 family transposase [Rikenellaceae bacterium]|nr:IS1634 family transposase [Rikenellaceae bacterium]
MYFTSTIRFSPEHGRELPYYKIKESFRDVVGRVHTRVMLTPGYLPELCSDEIVQIRRGLTYLMEQSALIPNQQALFKTDPRQEYSEKVCSHIERFWAQIMGSGKIDTARSSYDDAKRKARKLVDIDTIQHTDAREVGAENVCLQAIRELQLDTFLGHEGWSERKVNATLASLIVRTVYSPSEWSALRILTDNSAAMELITGQFGDSPTQREVYAAAPALYELKGKLERHLCSRTDSLFNLTNRVMLFDLTNFYFEGSKRASKKAQFGHSKEKRSDCRLLVLALAINTEGFIRYSSILSGSTADPTSLPAMVDSIIAMNPVSSDPEQKVMVVIDAGIATEANLTLLKERGYNYLCVSRTKLKDYTLKGDGRTVTVYDSRKNPITLAEVEHEEGGDFYLRVNSSSKALTERSMNRQWRERFELELTRARNALTAKGGIKKYDKVVERVGRALGKYPSVSKYYQIGYVRSKENLDNMADMHWEIRINENEAEQSFGTYFLRTNVATLDERSTWDYYNLIREIEASNRQLKTDLELRPIYHQKDENSDAHLFFGLLSYWIVNTIRHKLKEQGITHYWTELKRILSTQKAITTQAENALGERVQIRLCSDPTDAASELYRVLKYNPKPFKRYTIVVKSHPPDKKSVVPT